MAGQSSNAMRSISDGNTSVLKQAAGVTMPEFKSVKEKGIYQYFLDNSKGNKEQAKRLFNLGRKYGFDEVIKSIGNKKAQDFMLHTEDKFE